MNSPIYGQVIHNKAVNTNKWVKALSLQQMVLRQLGIHMQNNKNEV